MNLGFLQEKTNPGGYGSLTALSGITTIIVLRSYQLQDFWHARDYTNFQSHSWLMSHPKNAFSLWHTILQNPHCAS